MCRSAGKTGAPCELAPSWPTSLSKPNGGRASRRLEVGQNISGGVGLVLEYAFEVPMESFLSKSNI